MTIEIDRALADELGFDIAEAVAAHVAARQAHALTIGEPAPTAHPLVERIVLSGGSFEIIEPPEPEPLPLSPVAAISDRQFAQQLAVLGTISEAEALAWAARGDLPAPIEAGIAALPEGDRFAARMLLSSATTYLRGHPLVPVLGALLGYDAAAIDALWEAAAQL